MIHKSSHLLFNTRSKKLARFSEASSPPAFIIVAIVVGIIVILAVWLLGSRLLSCAKSCSVWVASRLLSCTKSFLVWMVCGLLLSCAKSKKKKTEVMIEDDEFKSIPRANKNKTKALKDDDNSQDIPITVKKKTKGLEDDHDSKHISNANKKKTDQAIDQNDDDSQHIPITMVQFFDDMERQKPIKFTSQQLRTATDNFSIKLGSGGFGTVYKGIIGNNLPVAVKVLDGTSNYKQIEEQFMAEVGTMSRTHHFNLVRLYGFCFEPRLIALVYEFMVNGSLDNHLLKGNNKRVAIGFEKLHEIALGTARGITYLHEECAQTIVHYDIKPGNILLDSNFHAKVADFGLAKLCNRDNTHITMTNVRGTIGYTAPEVWQSLHVTEKCDVYSFGMLLFEIIGGRRHMDNITLDDIQQWFPIWAWGKYETNQLIDLMTECEVEEKDHEVVKRMLKVALCCVQYRPETRPMMSIVVKMLEGVLEVPDPLNPFTHLISGGSGPNISFNQMSWNAGGSNWSSSEVTSIHEITVESE